MFLQKRGEYLFLGIAILVLSVSLCAQSTPLTLEDCFRLALSNNIDIKVAKYSPEIAEAQIQLAESAYDIFITGNYQFTKTDSRLLAEKQGVFSAGIAKRFLTGTDVSLGYSLEYRRGFEDMQEINSAFLLLPETVPFFDPDLDIKKLWTAGMTLKLTQPLLRNFGFTANEALIKAAENNVKIAEYEVEMNTNNILAQVELAYWRWIAALRNKQVMEISIGKGKEYRDIAERRSKRVEGVLPSDVNDANVNLYNRENELVSLEREIRVATDRLKRLIYPFDPQNPTKAAWETSITTTEEGQKQFAMIEETNANYQDALQYRPEIKQLEGKKRSLELLIAKNENALLPALDVTGTITMLGEEEGTGTAMRTAFHGGRYRWTVGMYFELPLGNLSAKSQLRKALAEKSQAESEIHRVQYNICLEIREALHSVAAAKEKYTNSQKILQNAQESLVSIERRYHNPLQGDFNLIFFLQDAEWKRTQASLLNNFALFEYKQALVQLKMAEARYLKDRSSK